MTWIIKIYKLEEHGLWDKSLKDILGNAAKMKAKTFMYTPKEAEYIDESASLEEAMHMLVMGRHQSLLATKGGEIVGILRLTDVFMEIFRLMKFCEI